MTLQWATDARKIIEEFSQETTANGVKFFFQGNKLSRIAFFLAWLAAIIYCIYSCYRGIMDFHSRPTGTKFEIVTLDDVNITFPAITLCNINRIRKDHIEGTENLSEIYSLFGVMENAALVDKYHEDTEEFRNLILKKMSVFKDDPVINITMDSLFREGGPVDSDILNCKVGFTDCSKILGDDFFERVVSDQGNCFKINPKGKLNASIAGNLGGITLLMHAQIGLHSMVKLSEPSGGFKISFHDYKDTGSVGNTGFVLSPGLMYFVQLSNKETKLLPKPYSRHDCVENKPEYRSSTCERNCNLEYVKEKCGCEYFRGNPSDNKIRLCNIQDMLICGTGAYNKIVRDRTFKSERCKCQKACTFETYDHSVSSSLLSDKFVDKLVEIHNEEMKKEALESKDMNETVKQNWRKKIKSRFSQDVVKNNIVVLKIIFPTIEKQTINQVVSYGLSNLLGDIGGVMGLFLGASLFTILEFLDLVVRVIFSNFTRTKKKPGSQNKEDQSGV